MAGWPSNAPGSSPGTSAHLDDDQYPFRQPTWTTLVLQEIRAGKDACSRKRLAWCDLASRRASKGQPRHAMFSCWGALGEKLQRGSGELGYLTMLRHSVADGS